MCGSEQRERLWETSSSFPLFALYEKCPQAKIYGDLWCLQIIGDSVTSLRKGKKNMSATYQVIEADLENGRVKSPDLRKLPSIAHVLITWIQVTDEKRTYDFSDLTGQLKWSGDAVKEQRKLRDEW